MDMLLASLAPGGVPRVGFLDCPFVLPIAGHDAFASSSPAPQRKKKKGKKKGSAGAPSVLSIPRLLRQTDVLQHKLLRAREL